MGRRLTPVIPCEASRSSGAALPYLDQSSLADVSGQPGECRHQPLGVSPRFWRRVRNRTLTRCGWRAVAANREPGSDTFPGSRGASDQPRAANSWPPCTAICQPAGSGSQSIQPAGRDQTAQGTPHKLPVNPAVECDTAGPLRQRGAAGDLPSPSGKQFFEILTVGMLAASVPAHRRNLQLPVAVTGSTLTGRRRSAPDRRPLSRAVELLP